jgi:hypothetical protein
LSAALAGSVLAVCLSGQARAQWDPEAQVSFEGSDVWGFGLGASGRTVHVAWGLGPIRYCRSTDEGTAWSAPIVLSTSGRLHLEDPVVASGDRVFLVYLDEARQVSDWLGARTVGELRLRRSLDDGLSFLPEIALTSGAAAFRVSVAVQGDVVHLTWMDYRTGVWNVHYLRSTDAGASWEPERVLVAGTEVFGSERPIIRALGSSVHLVWMEGRDRYPTCLGIIPDCPQTYYKRSLDAGRTWGPDVALTDGPGYATRPNLGIVAPSTILVPYDDERDGNMGLEQHVVRSTDDGATWEPAQRLTFTPYDSTHGFVIDAGPEAHLAWHDFRDGNDSALTEIYLRASPDGGATWGPEERVTNAPGSSATPLLGLTEGYTHAAWLDTRTGLQQVWNRRRARTVQPGPGEPSGPALSPLRVTGHDRATGAIAFTYAPACGTTDNSIHFGPLEAVAGYGWSSSACGIGNAGSFDAFAPGPGSWFFVVVGRDGATEGSYGRSARGGTASERPAYGASACGVAQDLSSRCD